MIDYSLYIFPAIFPHIPDPKLSLSVSWGCSGSHQSVIGMEDAVRHVGSSVWEECSMSGMSGQKGGPMGDKTRQDWTRPPANFACEGFFF